MCQRAVETLSILYLRCHSVPRDALYRRATGPFNSLFEMHHTLFAGGVLTEVEDFQFSI